MWITLKEFNNKTNIRIQTMVSWIKQNKIPAEYLQKTYTLHQTKYKIDSDIINLIKNNPKKFRKWEKTKWNI